jgi:formiminotetrahydrofolate cyclodeaminase
MMTVEQMAGRSNLNAASDLEVAGRLAGAAARGAAANVMINLPSVEDEEYSGPVRREVTRLVESVDRLNAQISQSVASGTLRAPEA